MVSYYPRLGTFGMPPCIFCEPMFAPKATCFGSAGSATSIFFSSKSSCGTNLEAELGLLVPAVDGLPVVTFDSIFLNLVILKTFARQIKEVRLEL